MGIMQLVNGGGRRRASDAVVELRDRVEDLEMELKFVRRISVGRKGLIRRMGEDLKSMTDQRDHLALQLADALKEMERLRATCRRQAKQVDAARSTDSEATQEIKLAVAAPLVVDLSSPTSVPAVRPVVAVPARVPRTTTALATVRSLREAKGDVR